MKNMVFLLSTLASLAAVGCAGQLTEEEQQRLFEEHAGTGGSTGAGSSTSTTTTGAGGSGPSVDLCIVDATKKPLKSCQAAGCHTGSPVSAGLDLSDAALTTNAKSFLDKMNVGTMGVTMPGDATGCQPGAYKLVDSTNAMNSLLYTKAWAAGETAAPPCGGKMPVIGTFTTDNKACLLSWINSVIALK